MQAVPADAPRANLARAALPWVATAALLAATAWFVDIGDVVSRIEALDLAWAAAALGISVPMYLLLGLRWRFTAERIGAPLGYGRAVGDYYLAVLLNQVLAVGIAGDAARILRHRRALSQDSETKGYGPALRAVILERISGQLALAVLMVVGATVWLSRGRTDVAPVGFGLAAVWLVAFAVAALLSRKRLGGRIVAQLLADARRALLARGALGLQLGLSLCIAALQMAMYLAAGRAIGISLSMTTTLEVLPLVMGATILPAALGGWGLREASLGGLFGLIGLDPAAGVAMSVTYGLLSLAASSPGLISLVAFRDGQREKIADSTEPGSWPALAHSGWMIGGVIASVVTGQSLWLVACALVAFAARIANSRGTFTPGGRFGIANSLTLVRILSISSIGLIMPRVPAVAFVGIIALLFAADGIDGWIARSRNTVSSFGQTFDMEADAYLVMLLCVLLTTHNVAGYWVLIAGLWRYSYAAFIAVVPARGEMPRSRLARFGHGILMVSLILAFLPVPALPLVAAVIAVATVTLSYARSLAWSFGRTEIDDALLSP